MTEVDNKADLLKDRNNLIYRLCMDSGYTVSQLAVMFNLPEESIRSIVDTLFHIKLNKGGR